MSNRRLDTPWLAMWFLQNACPGRNEALIGDLIERFSEGQTRVWFWKQVAVVFAVGVLSEARRHWPHFAYAMTATTMIVATSFWNGAEGFARVLHWEYLPWPWSQIVLELSRPALFASSALLTLALGLAVSRDFRWGSLFRTGAFSLTLITIGKYLLDFLLPWLSVPVPGDPYHRALVIPATVQMLVLFCSFLLAAWAGCRSPQGTRTGNASHHSTG